MSEHDDRHERVDGAHGIAPRETPDKGKGKEKPATEERTAESPSMLSRLENSARMAGGTFVNARAGLPDLPTASEGKGVSSGTSFDLNASSSGSARHQNTHQQHFPGGATSPIRQTGVGETFRPMQRETTHSSRAFDSFVGTHQSLPDVGQLQLQPEASLQGQRPGHSSAMPVVRSVAQAESTDGSAVAHLLSQPDDPDMMSTLEENDEKISAEDAAKLRAALFNDGSSGRLPWDDLLNFTPDFISAPDPSTQGRIEAEMQLGTADQDSAADIWLRQWHDVLSAYTDEVWGDLGLLVEQARKEVERDLSGKGSERTENPALSRLKMILAHVRGFS